MRSVVFAIVLVASSSVAWAQDTQPADRVLEKITLRDAIRRALARNPSIEVALGEVRRARGVLEQTRGASLPTVYGNGLYTRIDHNRVLTTPATQTTPAENIVLTNADSVLLNVTGSVPLLAPRAWAGWAQANENLHVVEKGVAEAQRQIAITVAAAYLAIIERRREVDLNARARATPRRRTSTTRTRACSVVVAVVSTTSAPSKSSRATKRPSNRRDSPSYARRRRLACSSPARRRSTRRRSRGLPRSRSSRRSTTRRTAAPTCCS
jgi:hypothetical protein